MTHEEWAEQERLAAQAAAIAHEHAVVAQGDTTPKPAPADGDPLIAWLDAAPVTSSPAVALKVTAALRAVVKRHGPGRFPGCADCGQEWPCDTIQDIAEALGVTS